MKVALKERPVGLRNWRRQGRAAAIECCGRGHAGETHLGLALLGLAANLGVHGLAQQVCLRLNEFLAQGLLQGAHVRLARSALVTTGARLGVATHRATAAVHHLAFGRVRGGLAHHPVRNADGYVLAGHVHPCAVLVGRAGARERLPCFHFADDVGILPAFGSFTGCAEIDAASGGTVWAVADDIVVVVPCPGGNPVV